MTRTLIAGPPRAGKTTYALALASQSFPSPTVLHLDTFLDLGHHESARAAADWLLHTPGPWIAEGTLAARALRIALELQPTTPPCDRLLVLPTRLPLSGPQQRLAAGSATILECLLPQLASLGIHPQSPAVTR